MGDNAKRLHRRAVVLLSGLALVPVVVLTLIGLLLSAPLVGLAVGVLVGAGLAVLVDRSAEGRVLKPLHAAPADPHAHARAINLAEGLCAMIGVPLPALLVVEDASLNALAAAGRRGVGTVVFTSGLLDSLTRVELEGVVAEELGRIRRGTAAAGTLASALVVPLLPGGAGVLRWVVDGATPTDADEQAVGLTRYPPGLAAALVKLRDDGRSTSAATRANAHLWLEPPGVDLAARIEALREL